MGFFLTLMTPFSYLLGRQCSNSAGYCFSACVIVPSFVQQSPSILWLDAKLEVLCFFGLVIATFLYMNSCL